jgi:hypothetical protein
MQTKKQLNEKDIKEAIKHYLESQGCTNVRDIYLSHDCGGGGSPLDPGAGHSASAVVDEESKSK